MRTFLVILMVGLFTGSSAFGGRKVAMTGMRMNSISGGNIAGVTCMSADMLASSVYPGGGVGLGVHSYRFNFRNISNVDQRVKLRILPNSKVKTSNSGGRAYATPYVIGPTRELSGAHEIAFLLKAGDETNRSIAFYGTSTAATITPPETAAASSTEQVCLSITSDLFAEIEVAEDRGAILASVSGYVHRGGGYADKLMEPPEKIMINSGRPF